MIRWKILQYYYNGKCEFLIVNLLKISILSKDDNFTLVKDILNCIILDDYEFDISISIYIQCFYEAFVNNNFEEAEIYMDTVSMADSMG